MFLIIIIMKIFKYIKSRVSDVLNLHMLVTQLKQLSRHVLFCSYLLLPTCNMFWCYIHECIKSLIISFNKLILWILNISTFEGKSKRVLLSVDQEDIFLDLFLDLGSEYTDITLL